MKYFSPIVVWYTVVFLHIILTLNVEEVRSQHVHHVKKTNFCYDKGIEGSRLKSVILKTLKTITKMHCAVRCVRDPCCRSVNFKRHSSHEGYGDCELLHGVKNSSSSEFEKLEMYEYISLLEPRKEYMICCEVCKGNGTHRRESGTCYCSPTDGGKAYVKAIDKCVPNLCHANATCQTKNDSFICVCKKGYVTALKNVALNKVTKQIFPKLNSDRAVDGNKNPSYSKESCTHTGNTSSPWWMVDLGQEYDVHHLIITNRATNGDYYKRLSNFEIRIGNFQADTTDQNPKCGGSYSLGNGETRKIVCPAPMKGRYVIIRIPGNNKILTLCEVEVYEEKNGPMNECILATSCKELAFRSNSSLTNGVYQLNENSEKYSAYCHMSELDKCGGGGWTLVMKMDGTKETFKYSSHLWSDKETYQVSQGLNGLTEEESKLASYWNTPFTKICLGMTVDGVTNWIKLDYQGSSLYSVIADGEFRETSLDRTSWMSLITGSMLQQFCNQQGFHPNFHYHANDLRLGLIANEQDNCNTPDSFIGFGFEGKLCNKVVTVSCGNVMACWPGNKKIAAFGFILVQ